jgi:hypothetical protein
MRAVGEDPAKRRAYMRRAQLVDSLEAAQKIT